MKLHANPVAERAITHITARSLAVAKTTYTTSLQISHEHGAQPWAITNLDEITEADITNWAAQKPELVILGSGSQHRFLNPKLAVALSRSGVGLECMNTGSAARTYNVLLDEGRNVLGAFIMD